jgi:hypothetical protein
MDAERDGEISIVSITSERELQKAHEILGMLHRALHTLKVEYADRNPQAFSILAEGPLEEIRKIQTEINEYAGAIV